MTAPFCVGNTTLCTQRLLLRVPRASDTAGIAALLADAEREAETVWPRTADTNAVTLLHRLQLENHTFMILERDTMHTIGLLDVCPPTMPLPAAWQEAPARELRFFVAAERRGWEFMTESVRGTAWYLFSHTSAAMLLAQIPQENECARRVAEKTGFWPLGSPTLWQLLREDFVTDEIPRLL